MIPEHRPTRLPVFLASALSKLYRLGIDRQNRRYDLGINVTKLDRPVISIGNLSTGGTGKTPLVQHVVRVLLDAGHHPVIAMRGYKAKPGTPGDEQLEHMDSLSGVSIVAQPDRIAGLQKIFDSQDEAAVDCVILDDGFQHRKIHRDLDIAVVDASRPPAFDALLPLGHLRESIESLERADLVVISHAEQVQQSDLDQFISSLKKFIGDDEVIVAEHAWGPLNKYDWHTGEGEPTCESLPTSSLIGKRVAILTAIGHPDAFVSMAIDACADVVCRCDRPDHDGYSAGVLDRFWEEAAAKNAELILTSRKDWTKLKPLEFGRNQSPKISVVVPSLMLKFRNGEKCLSGLVLSSFCE